MLEISDNVRYVIYLADFILPKIWRVFRKKSEENGLTKSLKKLREEYEKKWKNEEE